MLPSWMWTQPSLSLNVSRKWEVQMVGFKQSSLFALRVSRLFAAEQWPLSETGSLINELLSSLPSFLCTFSPSARHTVQQPPLRFYVCPQLIWKKHLCQGDGGVLWIEKPALVHGLVLTFQQYLPKRDKAIWWSNNGNMKLCLVLADAVPGSETGADLVLTEPCCWLVLH